jgi:hypothetical protein
VRVLASIPTIVASACRTGAEIADFCAAAAQFLIRLRPDWGAYRRHGKRRGHSQFRVHAGSPVESNNAPHIK